MEKRGGERVQKIPKIRVSSLWLPLLLLFLYYGKTTLFLCFALSSLMHEMGHILALRLQGKGVRNITIGITGTVIQSDGLSYMEEVIAAAAGPAVNLALLLALRKYTIWAEVNFSLLCYNLLPILPLDGGRILAAIFARWFPEKTAGILRGMCAATGCAFFFTALVRLRDVMALGYGFWLIVAVFLWNLSVLLWQEKRLLFLR